MDTARIIWFFVGFFVMFISVLFAPLIDSFFMSIQPFGLKPSVFVFIAGLIMIGFCWISRRLEDFVEDIEDVDLGTSHHKGD